MQGLHAKDAFATHVEKTEDDDREGPHPLSEVRAMIADAIERHRPSGNFGEMDSYRLFGRPDTGITEARFLRTIWRWNLPCSRSQLREIFRALDKDGNGVLDFYEFKKLRHPDYTRDAPDDWCGTNHVGPKPEMTSLHRTKVFREAMKQGGTAIHKTKRQPSTVKRAALRLRHVCQRLAHRHCLPAPRVLRMAFEKFERSGDGELSRHELRNMFTKGLGMHMPHFELDALLAAVPREQGAAEPRLTLHELAQITGLSEAELQAADAHADAAKARIKRLRRSLAKRLAAEAQKLVDKDIADDVENALRRIFQTWDVDSSGALTYTEMSLMMKHLLKMDVSLEDSETLTKSFDDNHEGTVDCQELVRGVKRELAAAKASPRAMSSRSAFRATGNASVKAPGASHLRSPSARSCSATPRSSRAAVVPPRISPRDATLASGAAWTGELAPSQRTGHSSTRQGSHGTGASARGRPSSAQSGRPLTVRSRTLSARSQRPSTARDPVAQRMRDLKIRQRRENIRNEILSSKLQTGIVMRGRGVTTRPMRSARNMLTDSSKLY